MRFTLLDRVVAIEPGKSITAIKTVSLAEEYLADHFPRFPVLPGVFMLEALTQALRRLPGVGPRSALRHAYHLLQHDREGARQLAQALSAALEGLRRCSRCNTFADQELCETCASSRRDASQLCVVETPADQMMVCGMALGYADPEALINRFYTPRDAAEKFTTWLD